MKPVVTTLRTRAGVIWLPSRSSSWLAIAIFLAGVAAISARPSSAQTWVATGSMTTARVNFTATLLPSGKVLVAGGQNSANFALSSAELYDPATGTFTGTGSMTSARTGHTATLLDNGEVLIAGGSISSSGGFATQTSTAELYDPATGTFTATGSMVTARASQTATLLGNGEVLVAGGTSNAVNPATGDNVPTNGAELYDPATGTFTATGSMITGRVGHTATLLNSGQVLVAGGLTADVPYGTALDSAELYDLGTGTFTATGFMTTPRIQHTATLLGNGKVLVAGGITAGPNAGGTTPSADLYDPATGTFTATGSMTASRFIQTATLLANDEVLIAGGALYPGPQGYCCSLPLSSAELYDQATGAFSATGSTTTARASHTATLLNNGQVLVAGGTNGTSTLSSAELFEPISTTTTVSSSVNPSEFGQSLTLTATVTPPPGTGTPTGTVTFTDTSTSTTLGTETLSSGQATLTTSSLAVGTHNITAQYSGDSNFQSSSGSLTQTVDYGVCPLYDQTKSVKGGATIPIKFYLCDANGNDVSASTIVVHATQITSISGFAGPPEDSGNANPDSDFRYDTTQGPSGGYIYNLSTEGLGTGTYTIYFTAGSDPVTHTLNFGVN